MEKEVMNFYASEIAKREAGKSQVKIGDIRQILKIFFKILEENINQKVDKMAKKKAVKKAAVKKPAPKK